MDSANATEINSEIARLRAKKTMRRKAKSRKSKIDRHHSAVGALAGGGASLAEIQLYLSERRCKVARSTVDRWLKKNNLSTQNEMPDHLKNTSRVISDG